MSKRKTKFDLEYFETGEKISSNYGTIEIIGATPINLPYVAINVPIITNGLFIKDKDLERFAINILKSIGSKRLKK